MIDRAWVRDCLTGPFASVRTPFAKNGDVDYDALRQLIDSDIANGTKTTLLTAGDSHHIALCEAEIADVARVTVEHVAGRTLVVAAERYFNTKQAVEYARYVAGLGADILMVMPPDWAGSSTPETLCAHYAAVAEHIPVMIVTNIYIGRGAEFGLKTIELALERVPNIVAIKDDMLGNFARRMCLMTHERWAVFSGGQKSNHLDVHPYGCDGYMSTFISFNPAIARRYWAAIKSNDLATASGIIRDYDNPFFDLIGSLQGGFDAGMHGLLEICGTGGRWRRPPYYSLSDAEMEKFAHDLKAKKLI